MGWNVTEYVSSDARMTYINIEKIDGHVKNLIDSKIAYICYGDDMFSADEAKKYILNFIEKTKDEDRKKGAIAEFLAHVYLGTQELQPEAVFSNLEENSFKKGFDGLYKDNSENLWYMESKSGYGSSATHKDKVEEACRDLSDKFESKVKNDPWKNAFFHVKNIDSSQRNLLEMLHEYSVDFNKRKNLGIKNFNIIPCGTIFRDDKTIVYEPQEIINDSYAYFNKKEWKGLHLICVTQESIDFFVTYLRGI